MMKTAHTPGPWVAIARTNAYIDIEAPDQYGYLAKKIASTSLTNHEANANLIAAAPDMLEALRDIASGTYDAWTEGYRAQQIAIAAIAKVTNGS